MKYRVHYPYITFYIHSPISIDDFFHQFHLSKKTIHLLKQNKDYQVNNRYINSSAILVKGDQLTIKAFQEDDHMYSPVYGSLDIIYEDEFLLIVNKPPFISIYPDDQSKTDSLSHLVSGYYQQIGFNGPVRFIHRLDFETSGLVIYCKCAFVQPLLDYWLSQKNIQRDYLLIVHGQINDHYYHRIHKPIGHDRHHNKKMIVAPRGKSAITHYQCISSSQNYSIVKCSLETGRKHQIRVHMAAIGHPLLGDQLYGEPSPMINRQALHAYQIKMTHPVTNEKMTIVCHPPTDMIHVIQMIDPTF